MNKRYFVFSYLYIMNNRSGWGNRAIITDGKHPNRMNLLRKYEIPSPMFNPVHQYQNLKVLMN